MTPCTTPVLEILVLALVIIVADVAQLGEREIKDLKVVGSNPILRRLFYFSPRSSIGRALSN